MMVVTVGDSGGGGGIIIIVVVSSSSSSSSSSSKIRNNEHVKLRISMQTPTSVISCVLITPCLPSIVCVCLPNLLILLSSDSRWKRLKKADLCRVMCFSLIKRWVKNI